MYLGCGPLRISAHYLSAHIRAPSLTCLRETFAPRRLNELQQKIESQTKSKKKYNEQSWDNTDEKCIKYTTDFPDFKTPNRFFTAKIFDCVCKRIPFPGSFTANSIHTHCGCV